MLNHQNSIVHILQFIHARILCIQFLTRTLGTLHETNSSFYSISLYMCILLTLSNSNLLMIKEDEWELVGLSFLFLVVIIFSISCQLIQESNTIGCDWFLGLHVSQNSIALFLHWKQVLLGKKSVASLIYHHHHNHTPHPCLTQLQIQHTELVLTLSLAEPHASWVHWTSMLMWHHKCYMQMEQQEIAADTHIAGISSAHRHAPLFHLTSLAKHKF